MQHDTPSWFADVVPVDDVVIDIGFLVQESFYFGPENGFTREQWLAQREPLHQPSLPRAGAFVLSADIVGHEDELVAHYLDVVAKARTHGRSLEHASYFWNRPVIHAPGTFVLNFPFHDRYRENHGLLQALASDREGEVFSDIDQGWALEIHRAGDRFYAREDDPDDGVTLALVSFASEPVRAQARALMLRVEAMIEHFAAGVGEDFWR